MTALLNMPRAAWTRQPSGLLRLSGKVYAQRQGLYVGSGNCLPSLILNGSPVPLVTSQGIGFSTPTNSDYYYFDNAIHEGNGTGNQKTRSTLCFLTWICTSVASLETLCSLGLTAQTASPFFLLQNNSGTLRYYYGSYTNIKPVKIGELSTLCIMYAEYSASNYSLIIAVDGNIIFNTIPPYSSSVKNFYAGIGYGGRANNTSVLAAGCFSGQEITSYTPYQVASLSKNIWQLFAPAPSRFYLIPSSGGGSTDTVAFSIDALIQRAGLTQSTSIDALLQSAFSRSLSIDSLIAAVQAGAISLDALLQIVGTRTVSIDALVQAVKSGTVSVDALVQMTLTQAISLDALIVAASASSASTDLDALIQALKTAGISLDALLSQSKTATAVIDALIQASKAGTVSLDAIIAGASSTTVFVGLDALIQAIQAKTISLDALLQKSYTSPLALDAYVALTQVKTMSLDALLQSTKSGVISLDAILQMTKTAMVSFDALIQAAKTGVISLDAILVFATQASVLLDAYVQKTLARGVGLDAIIGSIADMILPTGRVITVPASDRFVFVTHSDRFVFVTHSDRVIQIQ